MHHWLSAVVLCIVLSALVWCANRASLNQDREALRPPLITRVVFCCVLLGGLLVIPNLVEDPVGKIVGCVICGVVCFAVAVKIITTRIIVSDVAICEADFWVKRKILWRDIKAVRSSWVDPGFVILGHDGTKIVVPYYLRGAMELERTVSHRIEHLPRD